jgi:outer membrane protein assembly factor BamB
VKRLALFLAVGGFAAAQNRIANWPTLGGDPQRTGWVKTESRITKDTVQNLQLLWKIKLENQPRGQRPLTPPLILGNLISYRGFRELAFVGGSSEIVYAVDADLGKLFWQRHLEYSTGEPQVTTPTAACPGGLTATPTLPSRLRPPEGRGPAPPPSVYALSSDGRLHRLNASTGDDMVHPYTFLPANARAYSLNMVDNVVYTITGQDCNGVPNAVWAIDLSAEAPKAVWFDLKGKDAAGLAGEAIGDDGAVYVQTGNALLALSAPDLKLKQSFAIEGLTAPVAFAYNGRDLVVTAGKDGRLYLLDTAVVNRTPPGIPATGGISTWEDEQGTRWILAAGAEGISAYRLEERDGALALVSGWTARNWETPVPAVIANGLIFALSTSGRRAVLGALDGATGKELYSSRNLVSAPPALTGMSLANGRVYFATADGTLYCFGIYMEH